MAFLEIKIYPDPVLKKRCEEVKKFSEDIKKLGEDMIETLEKDKGLGLAAPQVGESKRIIVVQTETGPEIFINPKILGKSKETDIMEEGCLSLPGLFLRIKRAKETSISAQTIDGEKIELKAAGLIARIFQHEIDHLDGILMIDRINFYQRLKIQKKLKSYGSD